MGGYGEEGLLMLAITTVMSHTSRKKLRALSESCEHLQRSFVLSSPLIGVVK